MPLHLRQPRAASADRILEAELDDGPAQAEFLERFGDRIVDPFAIARLTARYGAEQHVLLYGRNGIVSIGVEEFDRAP